jgi:hypothetical protein
VRPGAYLAMPLLPLAAGLTYPVVLERGLAIPAQDIVLLLVLLGALGGVWALAQSVREGFST